MPFTGARVVADMQRLYPAASTRLHELHAKGNEGLVLVFSAKAPF